MSVDPDPFELMLRNRSEVPAGYDLLRNAIESLWREVDIKKLEPILHSKSPGVVTDGLYVLSEVGELPSKVIDLALGQLNHSLWNARFYLADCVLASVKNLTPLQLAKALTLLEDPCADVRFKLMELLAAIDLDFLNATIEELREDRKFAHAAGVKLLTNAQISYADLVSMIQINSSVVQSGYAGALLIKKGMFSPDERGKVLAAIPSDDSSEELKYLRWRFLD